MRFNQIVPVLQLAIGPVILISGIGLLLLSMTNRFGRVIDRSRILADAITRVSADRAVVLRTQMDILWKRARLIRSAISLATGSVLLASGLIILLFLSALLGWEVVPIIVTLFTACMTMLIGSMAFFLRDINLSLEALQLEIRDGLGSAY